jgi:hypothetical protein
MVWQKQNKKFDPDERRSACDGKNHNVKNKFQAFASASNKDETNSHLSQPRQKGNPSSNDDASETKNN